MYQHRLNACCYTCPLLQALRVWTCLHNMKCCDKELLIEYQRHEPGFTKADNPVDSWDGSQRMYELMIRWIAALACLRDCSLEQAAAAIHNEPARVMHVKNGQTCFFRMDTWISSNRWKRMSADMRRAWEISRETGNPLRKKKLQFKAMGCDIQLQLWSWHLNCGMSAGDVQRGGGIDSVPAFSWTHSCFHWVVQNTKQHPFSSMPVVFTLSAFFIFFFAFFYCGHLGTRFTFFTGNVTVGFPIFLLV